MAWYQLIQNQNLVFKYQLIYNSNATFRVNLCLFVK